MAAPFPLLARWLRRLDFALEAARPGAVAALAVVLVVLIGGADHLTGVELSFSIVYIGPIALAAWYGGRRAGLGMAVAGALVWLGVEVAGTPRWSHALIPLWNGTVRLAFFLLIVLLLHRLKSLLAMEQRHAREDSLTGAMNRRAFDQAAHAVLEQSRRRCAPLALAVVDVDNFKEINDSLGHAEGDRVLASVAGSLQDYFRQGDLVGRLGGDEFVVLLPDTSGDQARQRFLDLHRRLLEEAARQDWPIGFSIGVATFEQPLSSLDESLQVADALMYRVKYAGKNSILIEPAAPVPSPGPGHAAGPAGENPSPRVAGRTG